MKPALFLAGLVAIACLPIGCDSNSDATETLDGGPACVGTLAEVEGAAGNACPATYEDAMQSPPTCTAQSQVTFPTCGSALVLSVNCGVHGFVCVYEATSHALTAAAAFDDVANRCNFTSSCIATGVLPPEIECTDGGLRMNCTTP